MVDSIGRHKKNLKISFPNIIEEDYYFLIQNHSLSGNQTIDVPTLIYLIVLERNSGAWNVQLRITASKYFERNSRVTSGAIFDVIAIGRNGLQLE